MLFSTSFPTYQSVFIEVEDRVFGERGGWGWRWRRGGKTNRDRIYMERDRHWNIKYLYLDTSWVRQGKQRRENMERDRHWNIKYLYLGTSWVRQGKQRREKYGKRQTLRYQILVPWHVLGQAGKTETGKIWKETDTEISNTWTLTRLGSGRENRDGKNMERDRHWNIKYLNLDMSWVRQGKQRREKYGKRQTLKYQILVPWHVLGQAGKTNRDGKIWKETDTEISNTCTLTRLGSGRENKQRRDIHRKRQTLRYQILVSWHVLGQAVCLLRLALFSESNQTRSRKRTNSSLPPSPPIWPSNQLSCAPMCLCTTECLKIVIFHMSVYYWLLYDPPQKWLFRWGWGLYLGLAQETDIVLVYVKTEGTQGWA